MKDKLHKDTWQCPSCKKYHSKPHWPDHHQEDPDWRNKLAPHDSWDKGSNSDYELACETCGGKLTVKNGLMKKPTFWCNECNEPKKGVPAPMFCPHCGFTEERIILLKV